jgi:hypothetical protein
MGAGALWTVRPGLGGQSFRVSRFDYRAFLGESLSFFSGIGHFFTSLFGNKGDIAQKILHEAASFVNMALPIVAEVEAEIKALPDHGKSIQAIEGFLRKHLPDASESV